MIVENATKEIYLSDLEIVSRLQPKQINLIYAPVGSGKSTWVNKKLIETVKDKREILYLIDTTAGRDQIINENHDLTNYSEEWEIWMNQSNSIKWGELPAIPDEKVPVMTFSKMAWAIKRNGGLGVGGLRHIVLDECQNLKIFQSYGDKKDENVLKLLENWLKKVYRCTDITITALSATPRKISHMFPKNELLDVLSQEEKNSLRTLKNGIIENYLSIQNILSNLPEGKTVVYVPRISIMKNYCEVIKATSNKNVEMIWSRNNERHEMDETQWDIWDSILKNAKIPDNIDVLMFNAACLTGVNIKTPIDNVIVHDPDPDNQIQARGRVRMDIKRLFIPNGDYIAIPDRFIGNPLYKEDKEELAKAANVVIDGHLRKFPTISKRIKQSPYYACEQGRNRANGKDLTYTTISKKE